MKIMAKNAQKDDICVENLFHEINVLQRTAHVNLMGVFEIIEDNNNFYFVCEFIEGGDLQ